MERPTAEIVRAWATANNGALTFNFGRVGYDLPAGDAEDALERPIASAVAYVEQITGRTLDGSLPANLEPLAQDAVFMRLMQVLSTRGNARAVRDAIEQSGIASLRAGDFAVTFRDGARAKGDLSLRVNPWEPLNEVLLLLMTPERRAELLAEQNGTVPPVGLGLDVAAGCGPDLGLLTGGGYYSDW